jgi:hypothetical protein
MTGVIYEGARSVSLAGPARIVGGSDHESAWAEKHVRVDKTLKWILGNYVMADLPNSNGHIFPLDDLEEYAALTIPDKPLNMLHIPHRIVGHYVATEMLYPINENSDESLGTPHVEALSAFYHYYFEDEWADVQKAHDEGSLFYSMECVPRTLICATDGCGQEFDYLGRQSDTYCEHLQGETPPRQLKQPHFLGGALIIPPVRPGWKKADIKELSKLMEEAETTYEQVAAAAPHLEPKQWESLMLAIVDMGR